MKNKRKWVVGMGILTVFVLFFFSKAKVSLEAKTSMSTDEVSRLGEYEELGLSVEEAKELKAQAASETIPEPLPKGVFQDIQPSQSRGMAREFTEPVTTNPKTVTNWADFMAKLADPTVDKIILTQNLTAATSAAAGSLNRNLVIDGAGKTITFTGTANQSINIGAVSRPTNLTIMNLTYTGGASYNAIFLGTAGANWQVNLHNITTTTTNGTPTGTPNRRPILGLPGATANVSGENNWTWNNGNAATGMLNVANFNLEGHLVYNSNNANGGLVKAYRSTLTALVNNASIEGQSLTNLFTAADVLAEMTNTTLTSEGSFGGVADSSTSVELKMIDSTLTAKVLNGELARASNVNVLVTNSQLRISDNVTSPFVYVGTGGTVTSQITIDESVLDVNQETSTTNLFDFNSASDLSVNGGEVKMKSRNIMFQFAAGAANSTMTIAKGSVWDVYSLSGAVINTANSPNFKLVASGKGTKLKFSGSSTQIATSGGIISIYGTKSDFYLSDEAELSIVSLSPGNATPALMMQAGGGGFYVTGKSSLYFETNGDSNDLAATIRFRDEGDMTFDVSGQSNINIVKKGRSAGLRMYGGGNTVNVREGSDFKVYSDGAGRAGSNGAGGLGGNGQQAVLFVGGSSSDQNNFTLEGADSNVSLIAEAGPAIQDNTGNVKIVAGDDTYFVARGQTAGANYGIFTGTIADITFGTMKYYDFTNSRPGGGQVFRMTNGASKITTSTSDFSAWKSGADVKGNPTNSYVQVQYQLNGANLSKFVSGDQEIKTYFETIGMDDTTRINGNNQPPVIDELRVPTNADKYIWGHAGVPEGKNEANRDAWVDEVTVVVGIYDQSSTLIKKVKGTVVEGKPKTGTVSVYGDQERAGMFRLVTELPKEFLVEGYQLKVLEAWRGDLESGKAHISEARDLQVPERTVLDVVPPVPANVADNSITNGMKQLAGKQSEGKATAYAYYKGVPLLNSETTVASNGEWQLDLSQYLEKTEEVNVFLEDKAGKHVAANLLPSKEGVERYDQTGLIKPPTTNNEKGNINPYDDYPYHDTIFLGVKKYNVADVIPSKPVVTKTVTSNTLKDSEQFTQIGSILTYNVTIKNNEAKGSNKISYDAHLSDVIPTGLDFDLATANVTLNGQAVAAPAVAYTEASRELIVKVGNLAPQESASIEFQAKVNRTAYDTLLTNTAFGIVNSPQETPFVPGPINEKANHIQFKDSASVVNPGGKIGGVSTLKVEFVNEKNEPMDGYTLTITEKDGKELVIGDVVDLTSAQYGVTKQIEKLEAAGFEVVKRPEKETGFYLDDLDVKATYQLTGLVYLSSAPRSVDFGEVNYNAKVNRVDNGVVDGDLVVNDTRAIKSKWRLAAKLNAQMTNTDDPSIKLVDSLQYVNGEDTVILNDGLQNIYQENDSIETSKKITNISENWGTTKQSNGIKLVVDPSKSKVLKGSYTGVIQWQFMEATP